MRPASLATKQAYEIQLTQEDERAITVKTRADGSQAPAKQLHLYAGVWPWQWDFYLYKVEILRLKYRKPWYWRHVRETFSSKTLAPKQPLFSLKFYEPQEDLSVNDGGYAVEVDEPQDISLIPLTVPLQNIEFPLTPTLEALAPMAFPVTGKERGEGWTKAS